MKLLIKQRFFSWFDSYDIYDEKGNTVFTVEGKLSWGHCLHILNASGTHVGTVQEKVLTFLPKFELYIGQQCVGEIKKELTLLRPRFEVTGCGWQLDGDFLEWDYEIQGQRGEPVAKISKEIFNWTDTYVIDILNPADTLLALMVVLAIDAEKCSRN